MEWTSNLYVSHLFLTHDVRIGTKEVSITIHIPSLKEMLTDGDYNQLISFFQPEQRDKFSQIFHNQYDYCQILHLLTCTPEVTNIREFSTISSLLLRALPKVLPDFQVKERQLYVGEYPLTYDMLLEIIYNLQLGCGYKVEKPQHFGPDEEMARKFYERAQAAKRKTAQIKEEYNKSKDGDPFMNLFVMINYRFHYTFEQLYDMTLMQLYYLQSMASSMLSYEHGMTAYLTGNLKKAPKFFLK